MQSDYDVIVIGAGPAGMSGAIAARAHGLSVLLVDEQAAPGGQIWRKVEQNAGISVGHALGADYLKGARLVAGLRESGADVCFGAQVWQIEEGFHVYLSHDGKARCLKARAVLLATGAQERPSPFPGWTLPGVMTVGAAQILIKTSGAIPEEPAWIAGSGPLPLLYMSQLLDLGGEVAGYIDTSPRRNFWRAARFFPGALRASGSMIKGLKWLSRLKRAGVPVFSAARGLEALGDQRLETIRFEKANGEGFEAPARLLLTHEGVVPNIHFSMALGCAHDWNEAQLCFAPRLDAWGESARSGVFIAGDGGGIAGADAAAAFGEIAGLGIACKLGALTQEATAAQAGRARKALKPLLAIRPFLDALYRPRAEIFSPRPDTLVCRCECRTADQVLQAARRGAADPNQVKAAIRAGMGPCQGRQCGYSVAALVAEAHGLPMGSVGFFNIRPPLKPVTLGEVAALASAEDGK